MLEHWGVIPAVVRALGWALRKMLGVSGAESLAAAANVFAGQTEAPLLVRRYLNAMTDSELMSVMTGGFATVRRRGSWSPTTRWAWTPATC